MTESDRLRVVQFLRRLDDDACDRRERFEGGVATLSDRELPRVPDLNVMRLDHLEERLSVRQLSEEATRIAGESDRLQAALTYRRVMAYDEEIGTRIALGFEQLPEWRTERVVLMAWRRASDREVDTSAVQELSEEELAEARTESAAARGADASAVEQELAAARRLASLGELRRFAAVVDGRVGSFCELYADGSGLGVIRGVVTLPEFRGLGLARATVSAAIEKSEAQQHDLTFLRAVHDDWPKNLYGKLGFDAIGMIYRFTALADSD